MADDTLTKVTFDDVATPPEKVVAPEVKSPKQASSKGSGKKNIKLLTMLLVLVVIGAGVGTGYSLSQLYPLKKAAGAQTAGIAGAPEAGVKVGSTYGAKNADNFKDSAEGVLVAGGVDGEGSHHILRPGGKSQNVYVTSSSVDLTQFVDHKVRVFGETFSSQKAGWLMDVGRVEVLELNAQKPFEE